MSKCPAHWHFFCIIITVAYIDSLRIIHIYSVTGEIQVTWIILQTEWECLCQTSRRIYFSIKKFICCFSHALTAKIHFQNSCCLICPRYFNRTSIVQHNNRVRLYFDNFLNQFILACRKFHILSVIAFRFNQIRQSCENNCHFSILCRLHSRRQFSRVFFILIKRESFHIRYWSAFFLCTLQCGSYFTGINMTGTATLITGFFSIFANVYYFSSFLQRKYSIILQKNCTLCLYFYRFFMICIPVKHSFRMAVIRIRKQYL